MLGIRPYLEGKAHVIWDWNGTLLDDTEYCVRIINEILTSHGLPPLDTAAYLRHFRFPVREYYEEIGFDFAKVPFAVLSRQFIDSYSRDMHELPLHRGATEFLAELRVAGIGCSVLSAAHEADLRRLIAHHAIDTHFVHVCGLGDHYAHSKIDRGRQLLADLAMPAAHLLLVGDTDHDLEVADALGIDALLLTGGHQSEARLRQKHHRVLRR